VLVRVRFSARLASIARNFSNEITVFIDRKIDSTGNRIMDSAAKPTSIYWSLKWSKVFYFRGIDYVCPNEQHTVSVQFLETSCVIW